MVSKRTAICLVRTPFWNISSKTRDRFVEAITVADLRTAARGRPLLFEGAQGLLLDQDRGFFPHVTRSNTGLRNVLALADELGLERLEVTYATRAYLTRHGAGPLPRELPEKPYPGVVDATNVPNVYQGALRFGWLDLDVLRRAIAEDLADAGRPPGLALKARLAIACLDQVGDEKVTYYSDGRRRQASIESFVTTVADAVGIRDLLLGFGAERGAIRALAPRKPRAAREFADFLMAERPFQNPLAAALYRRIGGPDPIDGGTSPT